MIKSVESLELNSIINLFLNLPSWIVLIFYFVTEARSKAVIFFWSKCKLNMCPTCLNWGLRLSEFRFGTLARL